jgi:hypothetical protein
MEYQVFTNDGIRGVLAANDALDEYREWKLDADGVTADPLEHDAPNALKIQNRADIHFAIGIACTLALPMLIGIGVYIATTVLIRAS